MTTADKYPRRPLLLFFCLALAVGCGQSGVSASGTAPTAPRANAAQNSDSGAQIQKMKTVAPCDSSSTLGEELVEVIKAGNPNILEEVQRLLQCGAPVDYGTGSGTPLNLAAYNNDLPIVRLLVAAGARVNVLHRAPQEESTLELAIRSPYGEPLELVHFLVARGADVDAETEGAEADPGSSPQLAAIRYCNPRVLEFLRAQTKQRVVVTPDEVCRSRQPAEYPEARSAIDQLLAAP